MMRSLPQTDARPRPRWLVPVIVVGAVLLLVVLPIFSSYNGLVNKDEDVNRSFADLDAQLQRRYDLIPNLVNAVKAALNQEQTVFGDLARARANYSGAKSTDARVGAANDLEAGIGRLLVVVENYPQLQSNQNIRDLQFELAGTENRIAQSRRDYNAVVTEYNRSIRRFPRSIAASLFGFDRRSTFEVNPVARDAPTVDLGNGTTTSTSR
ncbi:MAG: LemA family protein [Acidimicrobiia bacterium]|nr:LemA family protein [Acidimicrobiia bacterium]